MASSRPVTRQVQVPARFKHWSAAQAREALAAHTQSGMSLAGFARREGLPLHRLQWWRTRLKSTSHTAEKALRFVPVRISPAATTPLPTPGLEVELRGGRVIRVNGPFEPEILARLVRALEGVGC